MEKEESKKISIIDLEDKHQVTDTFAVALDGQLLPIQLL